MAPGGQGLGSSARSPWPRHRTRDSGQPGQMRIEGQRLGWLSGPTESLSPETQALTQP